MGSPRLLLCVTVVALAVALNCASQSTPIFASALEGGQATLPFGPKQLPSSRFGSSTFTGAYVNAGSVSKLDQDLSRARAAGVHLVLKLVGARERFQNSDRSFSLQLWKQEINRLRRFDFAPYVADGTVIGAELLNEPHDGGDWGGSPVSKEDLEAAAAYAKSIWPYLPVGAGRSDYLAANGRWEHLDFGHSQYHMRKGEIHAWLRTTVAESARAGVALLLSLNFSAGQVGNTSMTAAEVERFGVVLAREPSACALTGYVYDDAYLSRPDIRRALLAIQSAARHPAPPCYVGRVRP